MAHVGASLTFLFYLVCTASRLRALAEKVGNENIRVDLNDIEAAAGLIDVPKDILDGVRSELSHYPTKAYSIRSGQATETHRCGQISGVPRHLKFITKYKYYKKYTDAYGIPVVSSAAVSDAALKVACYIVRFLFADRHDVRQYFYKYHGRVAVIGIKENTNTIPEFSNYSNWWNTRARGLGATLDNPISTGGEENLLCLDGDKYKGQDIFLHETAHAVAEVSIRAGAVPGFYPKLERHYNYCKRTGVLWQRTYAMSTVREMFAHGTQSYFDCNALSIPTNGIHNQVNNRAKLRTYDPVLFRLLKKVYPCMNKYYWCYSTDCKDNNNQCAVWALQYCEDSVHGVYMKMNCKKSCKLCVAIPDPKMNCDGSTPTGNHTTPTLVETPQPTASPDCKDYNSNCSVWAEKYCIHSNYVDYMAKNCKKSCKLCGGLSK